MKTKTCTIHAFLLTVITTLAAGAVVMGYRLFGPAAPGWAALSHAIGMYLVIFVFTIITPVLYSQLVLGTGWKQAAGTGGLVMISWMVVGAITSTLGRFLYPVLGFAIFPIQFFAIYYLAFTFGFKSQQK